MPRPNNTEYAAWYEPYIGKTLGENPVELVNNHSLQILDFIEDLPEEKADYAYATNKWTVKEVLQHMIDAERVFVYRAMRFARQDNTPLHGFDENSYAANSLAHNRSLQDLKNEMHAVRMGTDIFLASLTPEQLAYTGTANNKPVTVNAIAFIIFGHVLHHIDILKERYLL